MSAPPPPLPVAEASAARALALEAARLAPPPAPLLWRTIAFLVDASLFGLFGYWLVTAVLLPHYKPEDLTVYNTWTDEIYRLYGALLEAFVQGNEVRMEGVNRELLEKVQEVPAGVVEVMSYSASAMTLIFWIGFSLSEMLTGGASLGKRMCRLRVAAFPYAGKPGFFDSLVRNGWKAMGLATLHPLAFLFAIVDAHAPLFNPLRRSLHDYLSRTVVLDARYDPPEPPKSDEAADEDEEE